MAPLQDPHTRAAAGRSEGADGRSSEHGAGLPAAALDEEGSKGSEHRRAKANLRATEEACNWIVALTREIRRG